MNDDDINDIEKFSEDPEEHLKIENEILKIKLKVQYGDGFQMFGDGKDIPPSVENQFLKSMLQFEENFANAEFVTIKEKLGNQQYNIIQNGTKLEYETAVNTFLEQLRVHNIDMEFLYKPINYEKVYSFLIGDFLHKEIEKNMPEEAFCNFIYEEFFPNYEEDLKSLTHQIIMAWVTKNIEPIKDNIDKELLDTKGNRYTEEQVVGKINNFFEAFDHFANDGFTIDDIGFKLDDENDEDTLGMGHAEGAVKFDAVLENGEIIHYKDAYKIYYTYKHGYWYIMSFILPGYVW